jgi:hypothetical protein
MLMLLISIKNHKEASLPELAVSSSLLIGSRPDEAVQLQFSAEASGLLDDHMLNETVIHSVRSTINPDNHGAELAFGNDVAPFALDKDLWPPAGDQKPEASDSLNLSADQIYCKTPTA